MTSHPVVHIDIPAADPTAASQFYADVFGWEIVDAMPGYPMFRVEGGPGGGFIQIDGEPAETAGADRPAGRVVLFIQTDDIDASLSEIVAHGGTTVLPRNDIPGVGWWGEFLDPFGNRLALFTPLPRAEASESSELTESSESSEASGSPEELEVSQA